MTEPLRPLPETIPTFPGVYAARVLGVDDTRNVGRIKVAVPAVFGGDGVETAVWARPCFPWGHFFAPEVDDAVWVAFEHGDPMAPVWLGAWYADGAAPSTAAVSPPVKRLIRSASGHEILLDDTDGAEQVVVRDKTGSSIELRTDGVLLHCAQDLTIEAPGKTIVLRASSVDVQSG